MSDVPITEFCKMSTSTNRILLDSKRSNPVICQTTMLALRMQDRLDDMNSLTLRRYS